MTALAERLMLKLVIGLGCVLLLALLVQDRNRWKARTSHYSDLLAAERGAHAATAGNYRAAAEQARKLDAANAARVRSEQAAVNERTSHVYEARIAAARAAAQRLRADKAAAANPGGGGAAPVPGLSVAASRAAETPGADGFSQSDGLIATEQAIQLDELIKWVRGQAAVQPSD
jgi:hypothetical protein